MVTRCSNKFVQFSFFRPCAMSVSLVGDFNGWQAETHQMKCNPEGWWGISLALPPGDYRFNYLVDNQITEADFAAFGVEKAPDGRWHSVLWVEQDNVGGGADLLQAVG